MCGHWHVPAAKLHGSCIEPALCTATFAWPTLCSWALADMVIDLEAAGRRTAEGQRKAEPLAEGFSLNGWDSKTLTKSRRYNVYSDMHQIGLLIDEQLREAVHHPSQAGSDFVQRLVDKKLSARCALKDAWFKLVIQ